MRDSWRRFLDTFSPFLGLAVLILIFVLLGDNPSQYLSFRNLRIVLAQTVIVGLGAIGMTLIIISGGIDLSVGSLIALSSVVTALAIQSEWPPALAVLCGIFTGGMSGLPTGRAITRLRVVPFNATLGMLGIARGSA